MRHAKIDIDRFRDKVDLFTEAIIQSYEHWCDEKSAEKFKRERTDKSFKEVLNMGLLDKDTHWTILFRDRVASTDTPHWEFGLSTMKGDSQLLWINVREDLAEGIFKKFKLKVEEYG